MLERDNYLETSLSTSSIVGFNKCSVFITRREGYYTQMRAAAVDTISSSISLDLASQLSLY